jgi:hypothetical protein
MKTLRSMMIGSLALGCVIGQTARSYAMSTHFYRQGNALIVNPEATDEELQSLPPDPAIKSISIAVGPNNMRSALTEAGLESLARWTHLETLWLSQSAATDRTLAELAPLKQLRVLDLGGTHVSAKGLMELKAFPQLRELCLDGIPLSDEATIPIGTLSELRVLRFYRAPITDSGLSNLAGLKQLDNLQLGESLITDKGLPVIGNMTHLQTLDLRAPVTGAGLRALHGLSELRWLALGKSVDDAGIAALAPLKKLESLYLNQAHITDAGLGGLKAFPHLKTLDLSDTQITDKGMESLIAIPALSDLRLDGTRVTDRALDVLAMPHPSAPQVLSRLSLERTKITPEAIARLQQRRPGLQLEGLSAEQRVLAWLSEAPFDDPAMLQSNPNFSYEDWFKRGRTIYYVEETLSQFVEVPVSQAADLRKAHAAYALGWVGTKGKKQTIQSLLYALTGKDNRVRMEAAAALGRLGDESVLEPLKKLAADRKEDVNVRGNAYVALGTLGIPSAEEVIRGGTQDPDPFIVKCAKEGLRLLRAKS